MTEHGIADVLDEMRRGIQEAMHVPAEMLQPWPVLYPTATQMAARWRAQGDFIRAGQLERALVNAIFSAFIRVPNWRRVKRERRKINQRMRGAPRPGAVLAQRQQEQFELRRAGLLVRASADEITHD